eukprot:symbB.v1.2.009876.t1/scaffold632.1/size217234/15
MASETGKYGSKDSAELIEEEVVDAQLQDLAPPPKPTKSWFSAFKGAVQGDRDPTDALVAKYNQGQDSDEEENDDYGVEVRPPKPFVDTPLFNMCLGVVIALNSVTIGLETDSVAHAVATQEEHDDRLWYIVELIFCIIFLFELLLRLYFHRLRYFTNPVTRAWNVADFIIVSVSVVDTLILIPFGVGGTARVVAMLRFVRMMRLARLLRLLKLFKELWLMVSGLLQSLKTLGWICLVALLFCYACAIICTTVIGHNDELYDPYFAKSGGWDHEVYFATVWRSTFTLFQIMTLDQWNESVVRHVVANQPAMLIFFLIFVCISSLGLMSIMIGVVVENTLATANKDQNKLKARRERDRKQVFGQLQEIFEMADVDGSGTLKLEEVESAIQKPEIYNKLKMIDFPVDDPGQIFALLDYDESGELTTEEFITGCIRMKGPAKSKDLLVAQVGVDSMRKQYALFEQEMEKFQAKVAMLDATIRAVMSHGEHVFLDTRQYRMRHPDFKAQTMKRLATSEFENMPWNKEGAGGADESQPAAILDNQDQVQALTDGPRDAALADRDQMALPGAPAQPALGDAGAKALEDKGEEYAIAAQNPWIFERHTFHTKRPPQRPCTASRRPQRVDGRASNGLSPALVERPFALRRMQIARTGGQPKGQFQNIPNHQVQQLRIATLLVRLKIQQATNFRNAMSFIPSIPKAKDVITEEDIETWVGAVVRSLWPVMNSETKELLLFAVKEHGLVLEEQTRAMRHTLEVQSRAMQHTIETQGRQVSRLIAFGGLTAIFSKFWNDLPDWLTHRRWAVAAAYGLGVVVIILIIIDLQRWKFRMGKKKYGDAGGGAWNFAARFLLSAAVTAGVVSLFRGFSWSETAPGDKVALGPLQSLPTLPPKTGSAKAQSRVLKHSNGLCVRPANDGASWLILSDCGVMENIIHVAKGETEKVYLRRGEKCAIPEQGDQTKIAFPESCHRHEALYTKILVGTDLFLLQPVDSQECLAPESDKPKDGTRLTLGPCEGNSGNSHFQTSEVAGSVDSTLAVSVREEAVKAVAVRADSVDRPETDVADVAAENSDTLVHISGLCVTAQDEITGEDSTVSAPPRGRKTFCFQLNLPPCRLILQDCEDDPAKNIRFVGSGNVYRFQLGRQCGHPEDAPDVSAEPRVAFPADCASSRHFFKYKKLAEDERLPGFVLQTVDSPTEYCIHPFGGSDRCSASTVQRAETWMLHVTLHRPPVGTELINHKQCELGRDALRFRVGDPAQLAKEASDGTRVGFTAAVVLAADSGNMADAAKSKAFYDAGRLKIFHHAENGDTDQFEMWLNAVEDPNIKDEFGRTPLHIAALMGHVEIAKSLLDFRDCNCNAIDGHGRTPLGVALSDCDQDYTRNGREQIAELLREHKATEATTYTKLSPTGPV